MYNTSIMIDYKKICDKYNLNLNTVLIPKRGIRPSITIAEVFDALVTNGSKAHLSLGIHNTTLSRYIKKLFPEIDLSSFRRYTWKAWFLRESGYKLCQKCDRVKSLSEFSYDASRKIDGKDKLCKECKRAEKLNNKEYYSNYHKKYYQENKDHYRAYTAKRRANILKAIPPWADLLKIQEIYENCPAGYEVDHIFPLQGTNTCGLHVENNLQYLTIEENRKKSNKLPQ